MTKQVTYLSRIPSSACCSKRDVHVACEGGVVRRSDGLKSRGIDDCSAVQVMSRMRGRGKHQDKKRKAEKKQAVSPKRPESLRGQLEQKDAEESESDNGFSN